MGSVLGGPHRLLLGYTRCLGSAAGEVGAASWAWGAAGSQSSSGLLVPRMRWRGRGWTDSPGLGEGYRLEMSLESYQGGRGKARRGQVSYSTYVQVMVVLLDTTQSHKEWWSGAQLRPLVLCLSVTSHSCSEESGPHHLHFQVFSPLQITCTVVSESLATALWNGEGDGTHSSALAWRVPGTAEPGGLQSMGSLGVGHD